nr:hypothetical protein [Tanacetum cinerariifolium]
MVYGKKATDLSEINTNEDSISHSNDSVLFDFSDRYSEPSTNDLQTCDSSVECSRPNHSDHDSTNSISSVSAPASESRDTIVIDCDRQEDFPSVCSIETDVKSSKTLCNKFGSFNKESHFRKHKSVASKSYYVCGSYLHLIKDCDLHEQRFTKRNAEGKGILGRRPTGKPVNPNRPKPVSAGPPNSVFTERQNTISAGQPNPVSASDATFACNSIPLFVSAGDGILGPRPLNIQPKSTYFHSFTHNNQQIIFLINHNLLYSLYMTGGLNGKTAVKPSAGWPWTKYGLSKTKGSKINGGSKSKSWSYAKGLLGMSKGIRRDYSNARTPQQNGVAERKICTLIEAARTMLADSLLPTIFWTEAAATACYVLNRVLVTKPHDKTPYELLTGDKPSISYLKPFGCHVTILYTSNPLGKFDKKSNEGTGQAWMFDIDYLTDFLNYSRVSSTNLTAGSKGATPSNVGSQEDDSDSDNEPDVLVIQSTPFLVVPIVDEATTQNDGTKYDLAKTNADNLDKLAKLQALQSTPSVFASSTPLMSPCASPIFADQHSISAGKSHVFAGRPPVSTGRPTGSADRTPVPAGRILGKFTANASFERFPRASSVENSDIHDGLKIFDCLKSGIFTSSSYDEEFSGPNANNLESSLDVSSTITKRIHNIHPTSQVLVDINSLVQTRSQALADPNWVEAMQAKMQQFRNQKVWVLVTLPDGKRAIGTK